MPKNWIVGSHIDETVGANQVGLSHIQMHRALTRNRLDAGTSRVPYAAGQPQSQSKPTCGHSLRRKFIANVGGEDPEREHRVRVGTALERRCVTLRRGGDATTILRCLTSGAQPRGLPRPSMTERRPRAHCADLRAARSSGDFADREQLPRRTQDRQNGRAVGAVWQQHTVFLFSRVFLGFVQQVAPPREVYANPVNAFVAGSIGSLPDELFRRRRTAPRRRSIRLWTWGRISPAAAHLNGVRGDATLGNRPRT